MANPEFYKLAEAYDLAFSDRDFIAECNFYEWCFSHYAEIKHNAPKAFLELACGPANHAREFSKRGWLSGGIDLSIDMLEYAKLRDAHENVSVKYYEQNIVDFQVAGKYDLICNPLESISHILTNEDMITHLKRISLTLNEGGIYIIEGTHPRYFFPDDEENRWTISNDKMEVEILFGTPDDEYNTITQVWETTTSFTLRENGRITEHMTSMSKHRWYLYQEYKLFLSMVNEFSGVWFLGDYNIPPRPLDETLESDAMIIVLRK